MCLDCLKTEASVEEALTFFETLSSLGSSDLEIDILRDEFIKVVNS